MFDGDIKAEKTRLELEKELLELRKELKMSEQRLRAILDGTEDAILYLSNLGKVLEVNQAFSKVTGIKKEDAVNQWAPNLARQFLKSGMLPMVLPKIPQVLAHKRIHPFEVDFCDPVTNEEKVLEVGLPSLQAKDGITVVIRDVTARKKTEQRYTLLAENISDVIWTRSQDGTLTYVSPSIEQQRGYTVEEFKKVGLEELTTEETIKQLYHRIKTELVDGHKDKRFPFLKMEIESRCKDGSWIWTEVSMSLLRDEDGNMIELLGVSRDISQRKIAEKERVELQKQLRQAQKMEAIGRLAGGVAHDMNNVLGAIMGSSASLQMEMLPGELGSDVENILAACKKGSELTKNLLGFARKGKYVRELISLNHVVKKVNSLIGRTFRKIQVTTNLDPQLWCFEGDMAQIEHALMNVCINSVDAMSEEGTLSISTRNITMDRVQGDVLKSGNHVQLQVTDTGEGMNPEILDKVFEPFFTTKPKGKATGLGLSMVYGTIKNHNGMVSINSKEGQGTSVTFTVPSRKGTAQRIDRQIENIPLVKSNRGLALVIDDEPMILKASKRLLERLDFSVLTASGGQEGLEIYKQHADKILVVLLDFIMPGMDGAQTFAELRNLDPKARVLICSGYSKDDKIEQLLENGATGFLQKPFNMSELVNEVLCAVQ